MTQKGQSSGKLKEFNSLFLTLGEQEKDQALLMLKSLEFAQSVSVPRPDAESRMEKAAV